MPAWTADSLLEDILVETAFLATDSTGFQNIGLFGPLGGPLVLLGDFRPHLKKKYDKKRNWIGGVTCPHGMQNPLRRKVFLSMQML